MVFKKKTFRYISPMNSHIQSGRDDYFSAISLLKIEAKNHLPQDKTFPIDMFNVLCSITLGFGSFDMLCFLLSSIRFSNAVTDFFKYNLFRSKAALSV